MSQALGEIEARIAAACARAGREPNEVTLIAVSKLQPVAAIEEVYAAGQRHFGENYAQELRDKAVALAARSDLKWHAIGRLQRNKVKYVAKVAHAFHALDSLEIAMELSSRLQRPLACFVEVNLGAEGSKGGVSSTELAAFIQSVRALPNLDLVGLMALPPMTQDPEGSRPHFQTLRKLALGLGLRGLSMGTTADFEVAIEEGATHVRVGTAIFGGRPSLQNGDWVERVKRNRSGSVS
ncbi:MAG: YggS family pyridoxal phosphate-dependent enzyme [Myxococcaceae bacterium]